MKKNIIVLMVFTAVLCYSQGKSGNTEKVASKSGKIPAGFEIVDSLDDVKLSKKLEDLTKTVNTLKTSENNLYNRVDKLQAEKNALEKKFNELDTGKILENSQNFYSKSFDWLLVIVAITIAIGAGLIPLLQFIKIRIDTKKVDNLEKRTNDLDENLIKFEEFEIKIDNIVDETNRNFARNYLQMATESTTPYASCLNFIPAVVYASRCKNTEYIFKDFDLLKRTLNTIEKLLLIKLVKSLKLVLDANLKDIEKTIVKDYYNKCYKALDEREAKLKKKPKKKLKN